MLEDVQIRWTKRVHGLETVPYADRLKMLGLFLVQGRLLQADLILCLNFFYWKSNIKPNDLLELPSQAIGTRGHSFKISVTRTNHNVHSRFFAVRVVNHWNHLASETVNSSTLS